MELTEVINSVHLILLLMTVCKVAKRNLKCDVEESCVQTYLPLQAKHIA